MRTAYTLEYSPQIFLTPPINRRAQKSPRVGAGVCRAGHQRGTPRGARQTYSSGRWLEHEKPRITYGL